MISVTSEKWPGLALAIAMCCEKQTYHGVMSLFVLDVHVADCLVYLNKESAKILLHEQKPQRYLSPHDKNLKEICLV